ncbi:Ferredoxin--NADP reductase [Tepidimonas alkaliphilus]|uniref:Ferredoxin--NADP reductase n=1 Tax=Tepidimonas alkaliphilus TaxID=2588942 RepID=A0A554WDD6_9BURK|nr:NAD(P)/FAD-dependent oxidoreductase [Tepidimonas alkaliphilus]TSE21584.1 Ferredoxin--NADP reductase [Tepidimonas alkaliphilus]
MGAAHTAIDTDVAVIGAGPAGLWAAFQLGLQELRTHVLDSLPHAGGQCAELYPDKPIYDVPAAPALAAHELTQRLLQQLAPLNVPLHLGQVVTSLQPIEGDDPQAAPRWRLGTDGGLVLTARAVVIAAGVGAFLPRTLPVPGLQAWEGRQVFHRDPPDGAWLDREVVVAGGGEAAVRLALRLAQGGAARVTLLHRTDRFAIDAALDEQLQSALGAGGVRLCLGQPIAALAADDGTLQALDIATARDERFTLPLDLLLPRLGLHPRLGPIADWGLALERKHLVVDAATLQTSRPGIHAVGDIVHYPGKRKLVVCAFHEATLAAFAIAERLRGGPVPLEYTTTSPRLLALLRGVG